MSHLRKIGSWDKAGFDESKRLQILPRGKQTTFYLVAGADLDVLVEPSNIVFCSASQADDKTAHKSKELSNWEKQQVIRKITLKGENVGRAVLRALQNGNNWVEPITLAVVDEQNWRQVGKTAGEVTSELRQELQKLSLRDAVLRIAEDQMNSAICCRSDGFGAYADATLSDGSPLNWCGAFAYWCWNQAAAIKGVSNPFGGNKNVLLSPQKAIDWAMKSDTPAQLLRYKGTSPMTGKGLQEYREIGYQSYQLQRGDIVLVREQNENGWKHVCMIDTVDGNSLGTLDGNQGKFQSIKRVKRDLQARLPDKSYKFVFVHVLL